MAAGTTIDISAFATATNTLRRLLADLGLERKVLDVDGHLVETEGRTIKEFRQDARLLMLAEHVAERGAQEKPTRPTRGRRRRTKPAVAKPAPVAAPVVPPAYETRETPTGVQVLHRGAQIFHAASRADAENFIAQHKERTA